MNITHQLNTARFLRYLLSFLAMVLSCNALANLEDARNQVIQAVEIFSRVNAQIQYPDSAKIQVKVKSPDNRISFEDCPSPRLELHGSQSIGSRILVKVICSPTMALHMVVDISVYQDIVVSRLALPRKTMLSADHLKMESVNIMASKRAYLTSITEAIGKQLKRATSAGTRITLGMVTLPSLIKRGDSVVIIASRGSLTVRVPGTAMGSGVLGQQISVKNESSDRVIKGWVRGPGEVHVPF